MYRRFNIHKFYVLPTQCMCICVVCGSENKQRLFPYTALTGFYNQDGVCLLRGTDWIFIYNPLKPTGHYMYHQFNIHNFYVLPTQCTYVLCVDLRTNSDYFPIQH